ncbi:MAG TPA: ATP-binding protein [Bacillota bacterium]|nr:ATP-binding protein [Bacillota bacterium]
MIMIKRDIENELHNLSNQYPVITLTGPRQAGKTTLAKMTFPEYHYCNLELPEIRQLAENDPHAVFKSFSPPVIFDEIQRVPTLLSYIQVMADETGKNGQFILTGSHQFLLHEAVSQSLAGRTALLTLLPLSIKELSQAGLTYNRDEYILNGFLPRIYKESLEPTKAYRNYYQTYIERDLRQISNIRNLISFEKFMHLLAGRIGQVVNLHSLANDIGISSTTLNEWLSVLEASFIIYRLKPYYENLGKRMIKSPKLYFTDIGLAAYLLGITELHQVGRDPLLGNLFENLVVVEALKAKMNQGLDPNLFFFRDQHQNEVDLIYRKGRTLIPIEIKAAMTYQESWEKNIAFFNSIAGSTAGYLIYNGDLDLQKSNVSVIHFTKTHQILD